MPPGLEWETPLWDLYQTLGNQWRATDKGVIGLDMTPFIPVIQARGWDLALSMELLGVIEGAMLGARDE